MGIKTFYRSSGNSGIVLQGGASIANGRTVTIAAPDALEPSCTFSLPSFNLGFDTAPVAGGVAYGSSTSNYKTTAVGTTGQVLMSNAASAPTWVSPSMTNMLVTTASNATSLERASLSLAANTIYIVSLHALWAFDYWSTSETVSFSLKFDSTTGTAPTIMGGGQYFTGNTPNNSGWLAFPLYIATTSEKTLGASVTTSANAADRNNAPLNIECVVNTGSLARILYFYTGLTAGGTEATLSFATGSYLSAIRVG